ncbi:MAG: hypothetical protein NTV49_11565 [Kiritimatiellaeota bacterium]|nr:hypothetical protein [Kiritimatiellota bacterium]
MQERSSQRLGLAGALRHPDRQLVRALASVWRGQAESSRVLCLALSGLLLMAGPLAAFEAAGTIRSIDIEHGVLHIQANGHDHVAALAQDIRVLGTDGQPLADGLKTAELKPCAEVAITLERAGGGPVVRTLRLSRQAGGNGLRNSGQASLGLKPLNEMTAADRYKGEDGGLYGGGRNEPPPALLAAAKKQTEKIVPLDAEGHPSQGGQIGLVSISMSNATQEYALFKEIADHDPQKSLRVTIVDCAQGGQAMAEWVEPNAQAWAEADRRLAQARVSAQQVQVVWVKLANRGPRGDLTEHGRKLQQDTLAVLHNAKVRFPNLRIAYLGSRIYGGYAGSPLNPEPYAYEGAFAVRWLIQDQLKGDPGLSNDEARGQTKAPLLLWGPYFWANGTTPRQSDGLVWERKDLGPDGTHPSGSGRQKVAEILLKFFKEDALASQWFMKTAD